MAKDQSFPDTVARSPSLFGEDKRLFERFRALESRLLDLHLLFSSALLADLPYKDMASEFSLLSGYQIMMQR